MPSPKIFSPEKSGLSDDHIELLRNTFDIVLSKDTHKVYLFGSRSRGDAKPYSDIDLLITGAVTTEQKGRLNELFENSRLPFKVDLVADSDLNPAYRGSVEGEKVLFFPKD